MSLLAFKKKLSALGHFYTRYKNIDELKFHFDQQLDSLAASGFVEFKSDKSDAAAPSGNTHQANLTGSGAIAQGSGATAVGAGGVVVGGKNTGNINTGTQTKIDTGGGTYVGGSLNTGGDFVGRDNITQGISPGDLGPLFEPLLASIKQKASPDKRAEALRQVEHLKAEVAKEKDVDDSKLAKIVEGLVTRVPGAIGTVVSLFATPILSGVAGPVTKYVLDKLKGS